MFNFKNPVFSKLYRYYCRKLRSQWVMILLVFLFSILILLSSPNLGKNVSKSQDWKEYLARFWLVSLLQAFLLFIITGQLVSKLVGLYSSGFFSFVVKKSNADDIKVLTFTPSVNRETVIMAKFAAVFTYFFSINFLFLTLPFAFRLIFSLSLISGLSFLLLNGLVFVFANFLLLVPLIFYLYENYSIFNFFAMFFFFQIFFSLSSLFLRETFFQYPLLFPLLSVPLSVLMGYLFLSLYQQKFLKKDLG